MKLEKAMRRDRQQHKRKHGMRVTGRSVFTVQETVIKKGKRKRGKK